VAKGRSREVTALSEAWQPYTAMVGTTQRVWVADHAPDGVHLVRVFNPPQITPFTSPYTAMVGTTQCCQCRLRI
jgi:hypothetical protein